MGKIFPLSNKIWRKRILEAVDLLCVFTHYPLSDPVSRLFLTLHDSRILLVSITSCLHPHSMISLHPNNLILPITPFKTTSLLLNIIGKLSPRKLMMHKSMYISAHRRAEMHVLYKEKNSTKPKSIFFSQQNGALNSDFL